MTSTKQGARRRRSRLEAALLLGVGCITSPCCTPLLVPLTLALIAGTPLALWAVANLGLIYGVLTLISITGFLLGWRRLRGRSKSAPGAGSVHPATISVVTGRNIHLKESG